ncbi:MAG: hypothetical protein ABH864_05660 [archaeon]
MAMFYNEHYHPEDTVTVSDAVITGTQLNRSLSIAVRLEGGKTRTIEYPLERREEICRGFGVSDRKELKKRKAKVVDQRNVLVGIEPLILED